MKKNCTICGNKFTPGVNGTLDPVACDVCQGIERVADIASDTSAWYPDETHHDYWDEDNKEVIVVTRKQAFGL